MPDPDQIRVAAREVVADMTRKKIGDSDSLVSSGLIDSMSLLKLLGRFEGHAIRPLAARMSAHCNRVAVEDGHTESVSIKFSKPATREQILAAWAEFKPLAG